MNLSILDIRGCAMLDELPKDIYNITHLKIQREEPLELGPDSDSDVELHLFDGPPTGNIVRNIRDAKRINLNERESIKSLSYECMRKEGWDGEAMLDALQPHQNLQKLCIRHYQGLMFPSWMRSQMDTFLPNIIKIKLFSIYDSEDLPVLGQLPKLEVIVVDNMPKVRRISDEFCGQRNAAGISFPSLKRLTLTNMWELEEWVTAVVAGDGERGTSLFPCLEELCISDCPKLRVRPGIPPSVKTLDLESSVLPLLTGLDGCQMSLKHLSINDLEEWISLPESIRHLSSLETLRIEECESLATLPEWLGDLSSLGSLEIRDCPLIDYLPASIRHLTALKTLDITACSESL
ncbi:putative disease resistance protein At3g14460 [Typha latifolia]|uniref:putative disease resistance protein At3g14460 n=1 Tax=Typha latifolia TaxID=4733 RepID=UPI003C3015E5